MCNCYNRTIKSRLFRNFDLHQKMSTSTILFIYCEFTTISHKSLNVAPRMLRLHVGNRRVATCLVVAACMSLVFFSVRNTPKWPLAQVQQYPGKDLVVPVPVLQAGTRLGEVRETPQKYFHESTFDVHYDARFGVQGVSQEQRRLHLRALIQAYLSAMNNIGIETWLMHGSLLGWY
jgi:hypothetical protein